MDVHRMACGILGISHHSFSRLVEMTWNNSTQVQTFLMISLYKFSFFFNSMALAPVCEINSKYNLFVVLYLIILFCYDFFFFCQHAYAFLSPSLLAITKITCTYSIGLTHRVSFEMMKRSQSPWHVCLHFLMLGL